MGARRLYQVALVFVGLVGLPLTLGCGSSSQFGSVVGGSHAGVAGAGAAGGDGAVGGGAGSDSVGGGGAAPCGPPPACDAPPPDPGAPTAWRHTSTPLLVTSQGSARHRGRDLFLTPTDPQWVLAKFAYGVADKDLVDEDVDVYLLRGCAESWEHLGVATTTDDGQHGPVEGVEDTGGRIYFPIPADRQLAIGRHRFHLVVKGDLTAADLFVEVVPPNTGVFVSDMDGTLTTFESEEFVDLLSGDLPDANPNAAAALGLLAGRGVRPFYLTARPEWLTERSRQFLAARGFPPGVLHTTLSKLGALGGDAALFKSAELGVLPFKGLSVIYAFGNTDSDADAYDQASISPTDHRVFFRFDDPHGGRRIEDYGELLAELSALDPQCP